MLNWKVCALRQKAIILLCLKKNWLLLRLDCGSLGIWWVGNENDELLIKSNYFNFKINTHLNQKKQDLIGKIKNGGLSKQFFKRQQFLLQKSVDGTITAKEQEEALQMIPISSN